MFGLPYTNSDLEGCRAILKRELYGLQRHGLPAGLRGPEGMSSSQVIQFEEDCLQAELAAVGRLLDIQRLERSLMFEDGAAPPSHRVGVLFPEVSFRDVQRSIPMLLYFDRLYLLPPFMPTDFLNRLCDRPPDRASSALRWYPYYEVLGDRVRPYHLHGWVGMPSEGIIACLASHEAIPALAGCLGECIESARRALGDAYTRRLIDGGGLESLVRLAETEVIRAALTPNLIASDVRWRRQYNQVSSGGMSQRSVPDAFPWPGETLGVLPALALLILGRYARRCRIPSPRVLEEFRAEICPLWDHLAEWLQPGDEGSVAGEGTPAVVHAIVSVAEEVRRVIARRTCSIPGSRMTPGEAAEALTLCRDAVRQGWTVESAAAGYCAHDHGVGLPNPRWNPWATPIRECLANMRHVRAAETRVCLASETSGPDYESDRRAGLAA